MKKKYVSEKKQFSNALLKTLTKSKDVQALVIRLQKGKNLCNKDLVVLMIQMRELAEAASSLKEAAENLNKAAKVETQTHFIVDGKKLTPHEIAFREYCEKTFDEEQWLKKAGLHF